MTPQGFTVGALVQANHGRRHRLRVNGAPVGERVGAVVVPLPGGPEGPGPIIVVPATDAPLLPYHLQRLARRAGLGVGKAGGVGEHRSGDLFLVFSTANRGTIRAGEWGSQPPLTVEVTALSDPYITELFDAAVDGTEEAIVNALLAAETMTGYRGNTAHALDASDLADVLRA